MQTALDVHEFPSTGVGGSLQDDGESAKLIHQYRVGMQGISLVEHRLPHCALSSPLNPILIIINHLEAGGKACARGKIETLIAACLVPEG